MLEAKFVFPRHEIRECHSKKWTNGREKTYTYQLSKRVSNERVGMTRIALLHIRVKPAVNML